MSANIHKNKNIRKLHLDFFFAVINKLNIARSLLKIFKMANKLKKLKLHKIKIIMKRIFQLITSLKKIY